MDELETWLDRTALQETSGTEAGGSSFDFPTEARTVLGRVSLLDSR